MIRFAMLFLVCMPLAVAVDDASPPTYADALYDKLFTDDTKEVDKAYDAYTRALNAANVKIIKGLEAARAELNDPKKGTLSITERAKAIEDIDARIASVKAGAVGNGVVARYAATADPLTELGAGNHAIVGKWHCAGTWTGDITFDKTTVSASNSNHGSYTVDHESVTINWVNNSQWVFTWNGGKLVCPADGVTLTRAADQP
jgi:hypothetical protein